MDVSESLYNRRRLYKLMPTCVEWLHMSIKTPQGCRWEAGQGKLTPVIVSATKIAVSVCRVRDPHSISDTPVARVMNTISCIMNQ